MSIKLIQAIDVHAHVGAYRQDELSLVNKFMSGEAAVVLQRAKAAHIRLSFVSSLEALLPRGQGNPVAGNRHLAGIVSEFEALRQWVVIDPTKPETFTQADELLQQPRSVGIKIHPEEHGYPISVHAQTICEFAEAHGAIVQSHSGESNSRPEDFVPWANAFPHVMFIISHLGCSVDGDMSHQVRAIQACRHGNLYTDTSSAKSVTSRLIEWAVREIGADHILFGTDSPLYFAPMMRARIDGAEISDKDKRKILRDNAEQLFSLSGTKD